MKIKKFSALWCCLLGLLLVFSACNSGSDKTDTQSPVGLPVYDGWWYRNYEPTGISLINIFRIDAEAHVWELYDNLGNSLPMGAVYHSGGGTGIQLEGPLGDLYLAYDVDNPNELFNRETGESAYIRGTAMVPPDLSSFVGKWFSSGDSAESYYQLWNGTYELTKPGMGTVESGNFGLRETYLVLQDGSEHKEVRYIALDGAGMLSDTDSLYPFYNNALLIGGGFKATYYIRESAIGTPEGEAALRVGRLLSGDWCMIQSDGSINWLRFLNRNRVIHSVLSPGNTEREVLNVGSWFIDGDRLLLVSDDGGTEVLILTDSMKTIVVEFSGLVFYDSYAAANEANRTA